MGWGEEKARRRQEEMGQFSSYRALDLLPPLCQVACRLHASSLSFSSELVREVLVHTHVTSEAEGREEPARAAVFRPRLPEGVREGMMMMMKPLFKCHNILVHYSTNWGH